MKTVASSRCIPDRLTRRWFYLSGGRRADWRERRSAGDHGMIDGRLNDIISGDEVTHARADAVTRADVVTRWSRGGA